MALLLEEAEECPGCRGWLKETTDADREFGWHAEGIRCHKCAARIKEEEAHQKDGDTRGLLVRVVPKE